MNAWAVRGVELPFGNEPRSWWIDASGAAHDQPLAGAGLLPGRYVLPGLVDAHAHPALAAGAAGPVALGPSAAHANLIAWARDGITLVRDVGSPGGVTLELSPAPGTPMLQAAGRFLAPAGRYYPALLTDPVAEADLVSCALAEIDRGAAWVKVIADFPDLAAGTDAEATYSIDSIARLTAAAHRAGARVAVHSTMTDVGQLVAAGVDSVEHGLGLDEPAIKDMANRGTAWTPTIGAMLARLDAPDLTPERRRSLQERGERLAELLPLAARLGVPVLAGTDVTGSIPREVALLSRMGLPPEQALAAASVWPRRFLGADSAAADIVTYHHDPRQDPDQLAHPASVVAGGIRLR
ncbi:MAG TPA: amidohydrolase family protein [Streptosporangiaceae bacterium]|jgi:imidazolonepropionase-like amidohydrolase